jgi:phage-related protein
MTAPERKELFQKIFGQGTIQARRFFDLAIPNFEQLGNLTQDMQSSAGALDEAYATMFDEPASKAQLLANQYEILKTEIGDELIPMKLRLMEVVMGLLDWWNSLSEGTQSLIIRVAAFTAAFMLVFGVILTVVGVVAMLIAAIAPLVGGIAIATVAVVALAVTVAKLMALGVLLIMHWDTVKRWAGIVWHFVRDAGLSAWRMMQDFWDWMSSAGVTVWHAIHRAVTTAFGAVQGFANFLWQNFQKVWDVISSAAVTAWHAILSAGRTLQRWITTFAEWFWTEFGPGIMRVWNSLREGISGVVREIIETVQSLSNRFQSVVNRVHDITRPFIDFFTGVFLANWRFVWNTVVTVVTTQLRILGAFISAAIQLISDIWRPVWDQLVANWTLAWNIVFEVVRNAINMVQAIIEFGVGFVMALWNSFGQTLVDMFMNTWNALTTMVSSAITIISNFIQFFLNLIQGDWGEAWDNIKNIFKAAWDAIWAALQFVWGNLAIFFRDLPGNIISFIGDVVSLLWQKGWDILNGLWNGIKNIWASLRDWFSGLPGRIKDVIGAVGSTLFQLGKDILNGLWKGIKDKWNDAKEWLMDLKDKVVDIIKDIFGIHSPASEMVPLGVQIVSGVIKGIVTSKDALISAVKAIGLSAVEAAGIVFGGLGGIIPGLGPTPVGDFLSGLPSQSREVGRLLSLAYGWGSQWPALDALVMSESGWNPFAQNPTSSAFGIGQFLDSTWASVGFSKTSNPVTQIQAMLKYIEQRYGSPNAAWAFKQANNWYDKGAWELLTDQLAMVHKGEMIIPARYAAPIRQGLESSGRGPNDSDWKSKNGLYIENAYFGSEGVVEDLDWWAKTQNTGV